MDGNGENRREQARKGRNDRKDRNGGKSGKGGEGMNAAWLIDMEEYLNGSRSAAAETGTSMKYSQEIKRLIDLELQGPQESRPSGTTLYEDVIGYIKRNGMQPFLRENGSVREAAFYTYARVDKSTWSDLKWNRIKVRKKTLLKLALALKLNEQETEALLAKGAERFDPDEIQDKIIRAVIRLNQHYDLTVPDIEEILAEYQEMYKDTKPFDSIYETREMIADRIREEQKNFCH